MRASTECQLLNANTNLFVLFVYRHEDLKQMLDSNKDSLKLEAMKRIIGVSVSDTTIMLGMK